MNIPNFFEQKSGRVVIPPFLVPDAVHLWLLLSAPDILDPAEDLERIEVQAGAVIDRHIKRMAAQDVIIKKAKKLSALIADSVVGLVFDQADAVQAALTGQYANKYFSDELPALRQQYPIVDTLTNGLGDTDEVRIDVFPPDHPLTLLYAAWKFRRQVVVEGIPMSMVPVVGGESQGDTPSFTPALQRIDDDTWRLGQPGDTAPVAPKEFKGDIVEVLPKAATIYSDWYQREQAWLQKNLNEQAQKIPDHLYIPAWAQQLQQEHTLYFGEEVSLTNVSHGRLYRLYRNDTSQLFRTTAIQAIKLGLVAAAGQTPTAPSPTAIEEACLNMITRRGETVSLEIVPAEKGDTAPLGESTVSEVLAVRINGQTKIRIAWLKDHPKALGVVSGAEYPARAVLLLRDGRLGAAPFSFKTRQPDLKDIWNSSPIFGIDIAEPSSRRAVSTWAAWIWQGKAAQKKYQPPEKGAGK